MADHQRLPQEGQGSSTNAGRSRNPRYYESHGASPHVHHVSAKGSEDFVWPPPDESLKSFVFDGNREGHAPVEEPKQPVPRPRAPRQEPLPRATRQASKPSENAKPAGWLHRVAITGLVLAIVPSAGMVVRSHVERRPDDAHVLAAGSNRDVELVAGSNEDVEKDSDKHAAPSTGRLNIVTQPPGARVKVDGVARGITPVMLSDLPVGQHMVVLESANGSLPQSVNVEPVGTVSLVVQFDDVAHAVDELVADPTSRSVSPRAKDLRRRVLSALVRERYADARTAFDNGQNRTAADQLRQMFALLDNPDLAANGESSLADLRMLAGGGLLELVVGEGAKSVDGGATSASMYSEGDAGISRPVPLYQGLPPWPSTSRLSPWGSRGLVQVVIDEEGHVESAAMREPIQPFYDLLITAAAKNWRYQPALKDGRPVKYRNLTEVSIR
jgi:hypothetical protein